MSDLKEDWEPHINIIDNHIWYTGNITLVGVTNLIKQLEQSILLTLMLQQIVKRLIFL